MNDRYWEIARSVCTPKELTALTLRDKHELGTRTIAAALNLSRSAVKERLDNADRKIKQAFQQEAA